MAAIEFKKVSKVYKRKAALSEVDLEIKEGSRAALIGPNGVGKTTLMNLICGLTRPSEGEVTIDGQSSRKFLKTKRSVGYYHQNFRFPEQAVVRKYIDFLLTLGGFDEAAKKEFLEKWSGAIKLEQIGDQKMASLSHGETEKLNFLQAIAGSPPVLLLDEPFLALDINAKNWMLKFLKKLYPENKVTIVSSHNLNELMDDICNHFIFLKDGKVFKSMSREDLHDSFDALEVSAQKVEEAAARAGELSGAAVTPVDIGKGEFQIVLEKGGAKGEGEWKKELSRFGKIKKPNLETIYQSLYSDSTTFELPD